MKSINDWLALMIASIFAVCALGGVLSVFELQSSNALLDHIRLVQPGTNLNLVRAQLGHQMHCFTDADLKLMRQRGSIQDPSFYLGKKLYWFSTEGFPAKALEVYTDKNDIIVFVSWQYL